MSNIIKTIVKDIYFWSVDQNILKLLRLIFDGPIKFWVARNCSYNAHLISTMQNKYLPIDPKWKGYYGWVDLARFGLPK